MEEYAKVIATFSGFIQKHSLVLKAAYPSVSMFSDDCNPRSSKFGGKIPYLPSEQCPHCSSCDENMMMIAQLYFPSLPDFITEELREEDRDKLLVISVCPRCLGTKEYNIKLYTPDELDSLVYHDDVGELWAKPEMQFRRLLNAIPNSPFTYDEFDMRKQVMSFSAIEEWKETEMVPYPSVDKIRDLMREDGIEPNQRMNFAAHEFNMKSCISAASYLGGWPKFYGKDLTPGEDWKILLTLSESEGASLEWGDCGLAQIWMGTGSEAGNFKFIVSYR